MQLCMAVWMWRSIIPGITVYFEQSISSALGGVLSLPFSPTLTMRLPWINTTAFLTGLPPRPSISVPHMMAFTGPLVVVSRNSCDFTCFPLLSLLSVGAERGHGLREFRVSLRVDRDAGSRPPRLEIECRQRRLELGARHVARDEHDARSAVAGRPGIQRHRLVDHALHGVDRHRPALDVDDSLHPQEIRTLQGCEQVKPSHQPGARHFAVAAHREGADAGVV